MEAGAVFLTIISIVYWMLNKRWRRAPTEKMVARMYYLHSAGCGAGLPKNENDFDAVRDWLDQHDRYIGHRVQAKTKQFIAMQGIILGSVMLAAVKIGGLGVLISIAFWIVWTMRVTLTQSLTQALIQGVTIYFALEVSGEQVLSFLRDVSSRISGGGNNVAVSLVVAVVILVLCVGLVLYFWEELRSRSDGFYTSVKRDGVVSAVRKYISGELKL